jgi:alcohol dehydrogenase class IV
MAATRIHIQNDAACDGVIPLGGGSLFDQVQAVRLHQEPIARGESMLAHALDPPRLFAAEAHFAIVHKYRVQRLMTASLD